MRTWASAETGLLPLWNRCFGGRLRRQSDGNSGRSSGFVSHSAQNTPPFGKTAFTNSQSTRQHFSWLNDSKVVNLLRRLSAHVGHNGVPGDYGDVPSEQR